jgi:hypothetical protein
VCVYIYIYILLYSFNNSHFLSYVVGWILCNDIIAGKDTVEVIYHSFQGFSLFHSEVMHCQLGYVLSFVMCFYQKMVKLSEKCV